MTRNSPATGYQVPWGVCSSCQMAWYGSHKMITRCSWALAPLKSIAAKKLLSRTARWYNVIQVNLLYGVVYFRGTSCSNLQQQTQLERSPFAAKDPKRSTFTVLRKWGLAWSEAQHILRRLQKYKLTSCYMQMSKRDQINKLAVPSSWSHLTQTWSLMMLQRVDSAENLGPAIPNMQLALQQW